VSGTKFEEDHLSHYSPWSCGTIGSCINAIDSEPRDVIAKPISVSDYVPYVNAVDSRWSSYGNEATSSAHYIERDRFIVTDLSGHRKHSSTGDLLSIELQQVGSVLLSFEFFKNGS